MKNSSLLIVAILYCVLCNFHFSDSKSLFLSKSSLNPELNFTSSKDSRQVALMNFGSTGKLILKDIASPREADFTVMVYVKSKELELIIESVEMGKSFEVFNSSGELIEKGSLKESKTTIEMANYPVGIYILKVNGRKSHKIIKE
jgi:hypothetical protein